MHTHDISDLFNLVHHIDRVGDRDGVLICELRHVREDLIAAAFNGWFFQMGRLSKRKKFKSFLCAPEGYSRILIRRRPMKTDLRVRTTRDGRNLLALRYAEHLARANELRETKRSFINFVRANPGRTAEEIAHELHLSEARVFHIASELKREGISIENNGQHGYFFRD